MNQSAQRSTIYLHSPIVKREKCHPKIVSLHTHRVNISLISKKFHRWTYGSLYESPKNYPLLTKIFTMFCFSTNLPPLFGFWKWEVKFNGSGIASLRTVLLAGGSSSIRSGLSFYSLIYRIQWRNNAYILNYIKHCVGLSLVQPIPYLLPAFSSANLLLENSIPRSSVKHQRNPKYKTKTKIVVIFQVLSNGAKNLLHPNVRANVHSLIK